MELQNLLQKINQASAEDNLTSANAAVREYIEPLLKITKSCAVFESDKSKRDLILEVIRKYEPNFLL